MKRIAQMTPDQMHYVELVKSWSVVECLIRLDRKKFVRVHRRRQGPGEHHGGRPAQGLRLGLARPGSRLAQVRQCRVHTHTGGGGARVIRRLLVIGITALLAPATSHADDRDLEPAPPWIFFDTPDPETAEEIDELVAQFDQLNRVKDARAALVIRYGVLGTPRIVQVLGAEGRQARNEPHTWNAALTAYALRNRYGNARELWPLVLPLTDAAGRGRGALPQGVQRSCAGRVSGSAFRAGASPADGSHPESHPRGRGPEGPRARPSRPSAGTWPTSTPTCAWRPLSRSGSPGRRAPGSCWVPRRRLKGAAADATVAPRQAVLLAVGLLPGQDDESLLLEALRDEQRDIRRAAALAVALQLLHDHRPGWTNAPERMLRALKSADVKMHLEDGAEAVFARGVLAAEGLATPEWDELFALAQTPSTEEETARAAAQCLLFCDRPGFPERVLQERRRRGST